VRLKIRRILGGLCLVGAVVTPGWARRCAVSRSAKRSASLREGPPHGPVIRADVGDRPCALDRGYRAHRAVAASLADQEAPAVRSPNPL
jgi:hypothetical protein